MISLTSVVNPDLLRLLLDQGSAIVLAAICLFLMYRLAIYFLKRERADKEMLIEIVKQNSITISKNTEAVAEAGKTVRELLAMLRSRTYYDTKGPGRE